MPTQIFIFGVAAIVAMVVCAVLYAFPIEYTNMNDRFLDAFKNTALKEMGRTNKSDVRLVAALGFCFSLTVLLVCVVLSLFIYFEK